MNHKTRFLTLALGCLIGPLFGSDQNKFFQAVDSRDVEKVVRLVVEHDYNLNDFYSDEQIHLLLVALRNEDIEMFKRLLAGGADPNQKSSKQSQLSVGARILGLPMREEFLIEALRHGLDPNLGTPPLGSDEAEPLIFRAIRHNYQMPYFLILLNHGAHLDSSEDWLKIFERSLDFDNFRLAWYILVIQKIDPNSLEDKSWWAKLKEESSEVFTQNTAYWRDVLINEVRSRNLENE